MFTPREGEEHPRAVLTEKEVIEMRQLRKQGYPIYHISLVFHLPFSTAYAAITGRTWKVVDSEEEPVPATPRRNERKWERERRAVRKFRLTDGELADQGSEERLVVYPKEEE